MHKILLADDHSVVRTGLKLLIKEYLHANEIHEANNGNEIIALLKKYNFDLIIMDIRMPGTDALDITSFIQLRYPDTKILIFSINAEEIYAARFLKEGAKGFIAKDAELEEIKKAIQHVLSGRIYISNKLMEILAHNSFCEKPANPFESLSKREFEVAVKILSGESLNNIAGSLHLSPSTVGTHKARIFEKLHVANIIELRELAEFHHLM